MRLRRNSLDNKKADEIALFTGGKRELFPGGGTAICEAERVNIILLGSEECQGHELIH